jgi:hypothetical protein
MKANIELINGQILVHKNTGRKFEYIETLRPQFIDCDIAYLKNLKTMQIEGLASPIFKQYFDIVD